LLLHTAVRWLSWSKVLVWLFTLQNEIMLFLFEFSFNLSWLWFWAVTVCVLFWWYLFKSQWTELVTETAFSKYILTKTKQKSRLSTKAGVWVWLSSVKPDFRSWSLESRHPFFSDIAQLNGECKMNVRVNFGIFKCCSLEIPFNNHGLCHFDFLKI
jgi:hypothetical protein